MAFHHLKFYLSNVWELVSRILFKRSNMKHKDSKRRICMQTAMCKKSHTNMKGSTCPYFRLQKALIIIEGQAISEDREYAIPKVFYHEDEEPTTSPPKPTGYITPPSLPSAPLPPPSCPPPPRLKSASYANPRHVPPSFVTTNNTRVKTRLTAQWLNDLPSNPMHAKAMSLLPKSP
jgi:hypothetical protein